MYQTTPGRAIPPLSQTVEQRAEYNSDPGPVQEARFAVTLWKDRHGLVKTEGNETMRALMVRIVTTAAPAKDKLPLLKLARFGDQRTDKGSLRHNDNVLTISGVEADYDGERVSFDRTVEIARQAGLRCLVYTSPSHAPEKPRWRVLAPLSQETLPADRYGLVSRLNGLYGGIFAPESWTLSQSFFYGRIDGAPAPQVEIVEGAPIDLLDLEERPPAGKPRQPTAEVIPLRGTPPTTAGGHTSPLIEAAQANLPPSRFEELPTTLKNQLLREIARLPEIVAIADTDRFDGWLDLLFALADAAHLGATEAREIALAWSQSSSRFRNEKDFDRDWNSFVPGKPGGITIGTLFAKAAKGGFDLDGWIGANLMPQLQTTTVIKSATPCAQAIPADPSALAGHTAVGARPIIDPNGPSAMTAIPAVLGPNRALEIMNATFIYAHNWGGAPLIVHLLPTGEVEGTNKENLKESLVNRHVKIVDGDSKKTTYENLFNYWWKSDLRREVDRVLYDPEYRRQNECIFNLWRGFAVTPRWGSWRRMRRHLWKVICRKDRLKFKYLIQWMAHAVQHPGTAPGSVIVMISETEGTGKSIVIQWMLTIFGEHGLPLSTPDELVEKFNERLANKSLIGLAEASFPGRHDAAAKFKARITEPYWPIERKNGPTWKVPNIAHILLASNEPWVVPAGKGARRFLVMEVDDQFANKKSYFDPLRAEAHNGGVQAMLYDLLRLDLSMFDPYQVPRTQELRRQQLRGARSIIGWGADAITDGHFSRKSDPPGSGATELPFGAQHETKDLYESYAQWCRNLGKRPDSKIEFSRQLTKIGVPARPTNGKQIRTLPDTRTFSGLIVKDAGL